MITDITCISSILLLITAGICAVFMGIRGAGALEIKFPGGIQVKIKSGSAGLLLIFFGVIIIVLHLFFSSRDQMIHFDLKKNIELLERDTIRLQRKYL